MNEIHKKRIMNRVTNIIWYSKETQYNVVLCGIGNDSRQFHKNNLNHKNRKSNKAMYRQRMYNTSYFIFSNISCLCLIFEFCDRDCFYETVCYHSRFRTVLHYTAFPYYIIIMIVTRFIFLFLCISFINFYRLHLCVYTFF